MCLLKNNEIIYTHIFFYCFIFIFPGWLLPLLATPECHSVKTQTFKNNLLIHLKLGLFSGYFSGKVNFRVVYAYI